METGKQRSPWVIYMLRERTLRSGDDPLGCAPVR